MGLFSGKTDGLRRSGKIATLPASGRAVIVSDLHGHQGDFDALLARSRIFDRLSSGEDVYLVVTGDVPDLERHRALDETVALDGDVQILDRLLLLAAELGPRADRIVYLEGNHDFHVLRIAREVAVFEARRRGRTPPALDSYEPVDLDVLRAYYDHYRGTFGDEVFQNNIAPYDMVHRVQPRHLAFLAKQPMLAVLEGAGTLVTHAGPPKMRGRTPRTLRRQIERASREELSAATADAYYASAYHQLLNNRFRAQDYSLEDLEGFLAAFGSTLLVTGHTPHPYLVDFARRQPLEGCAFRDGLGFVGRGQVVLCTSFGAFDPSRKRYLELDLSRAYASVDDLRSGVEIMPVYPDAPVPDESDEISQIIRGLAQRPVTGAARKDTGQFDPNAVTRD